MSILGTVVILTVLSAVVILGILYLSVQIDRKISARRLKDYIRNEKRLDGATMAVIHGKEGKTVRADVLNADGEKFAELTVTGKSTSFLLRDGRKLKIK